MTKVKVLYLVLGGLLIAIMPAYLLLAKDESTVMPQPPVAIVPPTSAPPRCLADNEYADYPQNPKYNPEIKYPDNPVEIQIKDLRGSIKHTFSIPDLIYLYHPIEIHRCHVYGARSFNYDHTQGKALDNYRAEIWRYDYSGKGDVVVSLGEMVSGKYINNFEADFRVSPDEEYIALIKGFPDSPDFSIIFRNIKNGDQRTFLMRDVLRDNPDLIGSAYQPEGWTKDGKYFWGKLFYQAYTLAFFRIELASGKSEVFLAPEGTLGGDALNIEKGYVTHSTLAIWTGEGEISQQIKEQNEREEKKGVFAVYNLFTKQDTVLAQNNDPTYYFTKKWISDNELEYYLPSGDRKVYVIKP